MSSGASQAHALLLANGISGRRAARNTIFLLFCAFWPVIWGENGLCRARFAFRQQGLFLKHTRGFREHTLLLR